MAKVDTQSTEERVILDLQSMGQKNIVVLGKYNYRMIKKELKMHRHEEMIEICYLFKGTQRYEVGGEQYILKGGDVLVTPPNIIHGTRDAAEEKGCLYWMIIKIPGEGGHLLNLTPSETEGLIERLLNLPSLHFKGSLKLKTLLNNIFNAYEKKNDPLRKIEIFNYALEFLLKTIYCGERGIKGEISEKVNAVCTYIQGNIFERIELKELAGISNLSLSRFKHRFKEETGMPPAEYVVRKKIECSKEIIESTNLPIKDIAFNLNFSSSPYFATVFKRFIGMAPLEYRRLKSRNRTR